MKIRSKELYQYLLLSDVLHGTKEEIAQAKREYRRVYKRQWKKRRRPRKEIRIEFTLREFGDIKVRSFELGVSQTAYARNVILSSIGSPHLIHNKDQLLKVLQLISMATIGSAKNTIPIWQLSEQLLQAEQMLLQYLTT